MNRILAILVVVGAASAQYRQSDPRNAAIVAEQRYLSGDGSFGAQYSQEDGVDFKEESLPDGSRRGSYSYVDPNGQRHSVSYTAGKNGFQAEGDGIPQAVPTVLPVAPTPGYVPQAQYNSPTERAQQYQPQYQQPQYQQPQQQYQQPQPQYQPQQQYQQPQPQYQPQPQQSFQPQAQYQSTTPTPHRFYPPGKLSLNRQPDGFSFSFQKS